MVGVVEGWKSGVKPPHSKGTELKPALHCASSIKREEFRFRANARRKKVFLGEKFRVDRQAFAKDEAARFGFGLQAGDLRPGGFGIDEIFGDRRNATPIVDAGIKQAREIVIAQVRRGLDVHLRAEDQSSERDGAEHIFKRWLRMRGHGDFRLSAEILDDDFLDVAVLFMERSNGEE